MVIEDDETKYDEVVKEVKAKASKDPKVTKEEPFDKARPSKKAKSDLDEALTLGKLQGKYTIVPPITLEKIMNVVVKGRNLKLLSDWYDNYNKNGKRSLGKVVVEYMNVYSKSLIELKSIITKSLYI